MTVTYADRKAAAIAAADARRAAVRTVTADTVAPEQAPTIDAPRITAADQRTAHLAQTTDPAVLAAVVSRIDAAVARRIGGHVAEDEARAVALADALGMVARGLDVAHAVNAAARDAAADAVRSVAGDALLSLDATTADGTTTLADLLDTDGIGTARLSHYDDGQGIYRGAARVPHPEDVCRPLSLPSPDECAAVAWRALTPEAVRALRLTLAVNVAAETQARALADESRAVRDAALADAQAAVRASRRALAASARQTHKDAAEATKTATRNARRGTEARIRTAEVGALIGATSGHARTALAATQRQAFTAWDAQHAAVLAHALDAHRERLDDMADRQRRAFRLHPHAAALAARALAPAKRLGAMPARDMAHAVARARRAHPVAPREWSAVVARGTRTAARLAASSRAAGQTEACPWDAPLRPSRALAGWHGRFPLGGSKRGDRTARDQANAADCDALGQPLRSRQHADDVTGAPLHRTEHRAPAVTPRRYVPGPCAAVEARDAVAAPSLGATFLAECDRRRAIVAAVRSITGHRAAWRVAFSATA